MAAIALIVTDLQRHRFDGAARLHESLGGCSVLEHTIRRAARIKGIQKIVLVHPAGQDPCSLFDRQMIDKPLASLPVEHGFYEPRDQHWVAARKWALTCWRGGLGSATSYDEILPAAPLLAAMDAHHATSALLLRGEWCVFDDKLAEAQLVQHAENPEAFKLCFTQAPPGLSGLVAHREAIAQVAEHHAAFGQALGYRPQRPALDPIGREVNIAIPATVRDTFRRFIYDTPRSAALLDAIARHLGDDFLTADAETIANAARAVEEDPTILFGRLPQQVTVELTPRRHVTGPITPQHHVSFERPDMDADLAQRIFAQLGDPDIAGDVAMHLGGLGDALLHPQWDELVQAAHEAGVPGIAVETDLLCEQDQLDRLMELPIDVLSVRLNADSAETYKRVMGVDAFAAVTNNLNHLLQHRNASWEAGGSRLPWIVPRLVKTDETLRDMESFFDRWMMVEGHAMIEPAQSGCGLMPAQGPMVMAPPKRHACRQLGTRMTILSDGRVALCDQDWLGHHTLGDVRTTTLLEIWQKVSQPAAKHAAGQFEETPLCATCVEWHRP